jgi:hypothetical protein
MKFLGEIDADCLKVIFSGGEIELISCEESVSHGWIM